MVNFAAILADEVASFFDDFGSSAVLHGRRTRAIIDVLTRDTDPGTARPGIVADVAEILLESRPVLAGGGKPPAYGDLLRVDTENYTVSRYVDEAPGLWRVMCEASPRATLRR